MFPPSDIGAVQAQADALTDLVARVDPDAVPLPEAPGMWLAFDRIERLAAGAKVLLGRRVHESDVWQQAGDRDAGVWMARHQGSTVTGARVGLAASKRLANLPDTAAALRRGELSAQQVVPIADAATHDNTAESHLLKLAAESSVGELRDECGRVKAKADPDPDQRHRRIRANRRLRQGTDSDGAWSLWGRGPVEDGGELNAALGPVIDEMFEEARRQGRQESREAYAWDALLELARRAHEWVYSGNDPADEDDEHDACQSENRDGDDDVDVSACRPAEPDGGGVVADGSGSLGAAPDGLRSGRRQVRKPRRGRRKRMNEKYLALVRADLDALARGHVEGDEVCEIGGAAVPASVARQVLGNAVLKLIITKGQDVMSVTHLGRGPNAAQKIALRWLSPTCTVLGCNRTDLQHDHRKDWHITHHTRLDELDNLCTGHHDLKTRKDWALLPGKGKRRMVPPSDPRHPRHDNDERRPRPQALAA